VLKIGQALVSIVIISAIDATLWRALHDEAAVRAQVGRWSYGGGKSERRAANAVHGTP